MPKINSDASTTLITVFSTKQKFEEKKSMPILNERQNKITKYINEKRMITTKECADLLNVSTDTALRELSKLTKIGLIDKKGIGKATYYIII